MVEGPSLFGGALPARLCLDGDFELGHIPFDPAILQFFLFIDAPARLTGDAKAGVVEDEDKGGLGAEMGVSCLEKGERVLDVLDRENAGGVGKFFIGEIEGMPEVMDEKLVGGFRVVFLCGLDKRAGPIDP